MQLSRLVEALRLKGVLLVDIHEARGSLHAAIQNPKLYALLLQQFHWRAFDIGGVRLYGNGVDEEDSLVDLFSDKTLTAGLLSAGFVPFGRPTSGHYDRICFDVCGRARAFDAPVVRVDHEAILSFNKMPRPKTISESLVSMICDN